MLSGNAKLWKDSVEFVSITLDPKRDNPEVLNRYARLFGADLAAWHFLTGEPAQVASVIKAWGMWVKSDPTGVLDHSSRIFLSISRAISVRFTTSSFSRPKAFSRTYGNY